MPVVKWSEAFATGVERIDAQHRELLDRVGRLLSAVDEDPDAVAGCLEFLGQYAVEHFSTEELLMEQGYADAAAHREAHARFVRAFGGLRFDLEIQGLGAGMRERIGHWMVDWLIDHILGMDRALGDWLSARGAGRPG